MEVFEYWLFSNSWEVGDYQERLISHLNEKILYGNDNYENTL